jgi:hypothetical protein
MGFDGLFSAAGRVSAPELQQTVPTTTHISTFCNFMLGRILHGTSHPELSRAILR